MHPAREWGYSSRSKNASDQCPVALDCSGRRVLAKKNAAASDVLTTAPMEIGFL
jgi:hypothetical protein